MAFIAACNKFIYIEILQKEIKEITPPPLIVKTNRKNNQAPALNKGLIKLISDSINDLAEEDGWVFLGVLGNLILKKHPDFDPRNYGFKKLVDLIKNIGEIEIDARQTGKNNISHFYVRVK